MKTFFEKIPLKEGRTVLVNYTSSVTDATLERKWRYTVSYFNEKTQSFGQRRFTCLAQARVACWNNLKNQILPLKPIAASETDDEAIEEILNAEELYDAQHPPIDTTPPSFSVRDPDVTGPDKPLR